MIRHDLMTLVAALTGALPLAACGGGGGGDSPSSVSTGKTPVVLFTDLPSGPVNGGENGLGAYLSIFGRDFGDPAGLGSTTKVTIGGVAVANYRYLGASKVGGREGLQQLIVQVGALAGDALGTAQPVVVSVGGNPSHSSVTFTPNPGHVLFVSLTGSDSTGALDDIKHPYRYLQNNSAGTGAYANVHAGDQIVVRGGMWSDIKGIDGTWLRFGSTTGTAPTGAAHTGWIHVTSYPGPVNGNAPEDVHYVTPANSTGGIQGPWSAMHSYGNYLAISNLHLESSATANTDAAPINMQYSSGPWRLANNELGPWPSTLASPNNAKAGGVSGEGKGAEILGNYIHDIACAEGQASNPLENHGIYIDDDGSYNIGWNVISNITGGNGFQVYTNGGFSTVTNNINFHHNIVDGVGKHGVNLADGTGNNVQVYDNLIANTQYSGLRFNTTNLSNAKVWSNTFYNTVLNSRAKQGGNYGVISNDWNLSAGSVSFVGNIFYASAGTQFLGGSVGLGGNLGSWANDIWFNGTDAVPSFATAAVDADPLFVSAGSDYHLGIGSPAIGAGSSTASALVTDDLYGTARTSTVDVGAIANTASTK
ncbi:MAG: hypothetical protein ABIO42_01555 [Burkholderiaceae bacterium]